MDKKINCIVVIDKDATHRYIAERAIQEANLSERYHLEKDSESAMEFILKYRKEHGVCPGLIFLDVPSVHSTESVLSFIDQYNTYDIQRRGREGAITLMTQLPEIIDELVLRSGIKAVIEKPLKKNHIEEIFHRYHSQIQESARKDSYS